jgi:hypothetical protein
MQTYKSKRGVTYNITQTLDPTICLVEVQGPMDVQQNILLTTDQINRLRQWLQGEGLIQELLNDLSADQRETLLTGIGPGRWNEMFHKVWTR